MCKTSTTAMLQGNTSDVQDNLPFSGWTSLPLATHPEREKHSNKTQILQTDIITSQASDDRLCVSSAETCQL